MAYEGKWTAQTVRKTFLSYFEERGHTIGTIRYLMDIHFKGSTNNLPLPFPQQYRQDPLSLTMILPCSSPTPA